MSQIRVWVIASLLVAVMVSGGAAQDTKPVARAVALTQSSAGYQELLSGPPTSAGMKSGLVVLSPGKSVGRHSTEDHEELVVVLEGHGQMVLTDGSRVDISPQAAAYSPPGTEHDVVNTGKGVLRYIYVVSPAPVRVKAQGGSMAKVTGLGGVFFKAKDPKAMYAWYEEHLGIQGEASKGGAMFYWRYNDDPEKTGTTVWSIFPENTKYFGTGSAPFMFNYLVDDLKGLLEKLKAEGVTVDPKVEEADYGKFGWITDPEGNRIELWEPAKEKK